MLVQRRRCYTNIFRLLGIIVVRCPRAGTMDAQARGLTHGSYLTFKTLKYFFVI